MAPDEKRLDDMRHEYTRCQDLQVSRWDNHYAHHEDRDKETRANHRNVMALIIMVAIGLVTDILFHFL